MFHEKAIGSKCLWFCNLVWHWLRAVVPEWEGVGSRLCRSPVSSHVDLSTHLIFFIDRPASSIRGGTELILLMISHSSGLRYGFPDKSMHSRCNSLTECGIVLSMFLLAEKYLNDLSSPMLGGSSRSPLESSFKQTSFFILQNDTGRRWIWFPHKSSTFRLFPIAESHKHGGNSVILLAERCSCDSACSLRKALGRAVRELPVMFNESKCLRKKILGSKPFSAQLVIVNFCREAGKGLLTG